MEFKETIRRRMLGTRNMLPPSEVEERSKSICNFVLESEEFKSAGTVGAYFAAGSEVRTDMIIKAGKQLALPRVEGEKIAFYNVSNLHDLVQGRFGIMEPAAPASPARKIDLLVVPGIAFDKKGYRLGYGKGYYDRFLSKSKPFAIGLAYSFQLLETLPHDVHDKKLDAIATESGITYV